MTIILTIKPRSQFTLLALDDDGLDNLSRAIEDVRAGNEVILGDRPSLKLRRMTAEEATSHAS